MKENVWSQILSGGLIVVSLTMLAGCQSSPISQAAAPAPLAQIANISAAPGQKVEVTATVDPADRKFFNPGYELYAPSNDLTKYHQSEWTYTPTTSLSPEELRNMDPADRKFFNPGYGLYAHRNDLTAYHESEWDRSPNTGLSIEELQKIDPADRKFFIPGYGAFPISEK